MGVHGALELVQLLLRGIRGIYGHGTLDGREAFRYRFINTEEAAQVELALHTTGHGFDLNAHHGGKGLVRDLLARRQSTKTNVHGVRPGILAARHRRRLVHDRLAVLRRVREAQFGAQAIC